MVSLPLAGLSYGGTVWSLAVLADGRLASASDDGKIKMWLIDERKLIAAFCLRAGRNLMKDEWARYIGPDIPGNRAAGTSPRTGEPLKSSLRVQRLHVFPPAEAGRLPVPLLLAIACSWADAHLACSCEISPSIRSASKASRFSPFSAFA